MVFHYTVGKPGTLSGRISLASAQKAVTQATVEGLFFAGEMPNKLKHPVPPFGCFTEVEL